MSTQQSNQGSGNISEAAIAPETAGTSPQSAEAEALLSNESDEAKAMADEPGEVGLSEEMSETPEAAEAEVIEHVNSGAGDGASSSAPVDPQMAALANNAKQNASQDK